MSCPGVHCPGCGKGGGWLAFLAAAAIVTAVIRRPVENAADAVGRVVVEVLQVAAITAASLAGLAALAGAAYGARRLQRWHAANRQAIPSHTPIAQRATEALSAPQHAAIEAPRDGPGDAPFANYPRKASR